MYLLFAYNIGANDEHIHASEKSPEEEEEEEEAEKEELWHLCG